MNGHLDLAFGPLAATGGATPAYSTADHSCRSTYCHGATVSGGSLKSPIWTTVDGSQAACGTCHGAPPPSPHAAVDVSVGPKACNPCHAGTVDGTGAVIPPSAGGKHLDGLVEATGHSASWMDRVSAGFHAYSADSNIAACQGCHGPGLDGVGGTTSTSCATCHDIGLPAGVSWKSNCTMCHGGTDNQSGAPPKAIWGYAGDPSRGGGTADPVRVGAHSAHIAGRSSDGTTLSAPFDCDVCHLKPADALSVGHLDGTTATVTFSGLASQGAISSPTWARATATCASTYCHGAFKNGASATVNWTQAGSLGCTSCHGAPPGGSHPQNSNCVNCHPGYTQTSVNPTTHVNGTIDLVGLTCTTCHGDAQRAPTTLNPQLAAAPPSDTLGNSGATFPGVGAHQAHLSDGPLRGALACTECHAVPTSTATHPTGTLDLTWGTLATTDGAHPLYAGGTCSSTYCHGATLPAGGTNQAPSWTGGSGEVACGTCHGIPPPNPPHPVVAGGPSACSGCHSATVDATGAIIPASAGGKHLDGTVQATGGHGASWMDQASPDFHAYSANRGLGACQGCHGTDLDGVGGMTTVACGQCHDAALPPGVASWKTNCVMCHGGTSNASGAPPRTRWPGETSTAARGVGTHSSHVTGRLGGGTGTALSAPFDCTACHVKPTSCLSEGHVDDSVQVTGYTGSDPALAAAVTDPGWSPAAATCATAYCHGATLQGGSRTAPTWTTVDGSQAACGTCHGRPPPTGSPYIGGRSGHEFHVSLQGVACSRCHVGYTSSAVDPALHVNGIRDVVFQYGLPDPANPDPVAACNSPITLTARISGWDCAGCHTYKDAWSNACCGIVTCY
jgi:predicted CxxxxCH...CXXCH cytochrome family protein